MEVVKLSKQTLNKAVEAIKEGQVVVFPTDTVYGFLADAGNKKAVDKIYKIKKRPRSKPLAVFVKDSKMAKELAEISEKQMRILVKYWLARPKPTGGGGPGKSTFILRRKSAEDGPLQKLYGVDKNTIALRIPKYKPLNNLLKKINKPLAQTSVNISGKPTLTKINDIINYVKNCGVSDTPQFLIIDGGDLPKRKPSRIIDLTGKVLTRLR